MGLTISPFIHIRVHPWWVWLFLSFIRNYVHRWWVWLFHFSYICKAIVGLTVPPFVHNYVHPWWVWLFHLSYIIIYIHGESDCSTMVSLTVPPFIHSYVHPWWIWLFHLSDICTSLMDLTLPPDGSDCYTFHTYVHPWREEVHLFFRKLNRLRFICHFFPQNFQINLCAGQTEFLVWLLVWKCQRICKNSEQNYTEYIQVNMFMIRSSR